MPRLIDANSAKSSILVVADCITIDCDWLNGYKTGLLAATEAIDEIPTIEVPQWIPVTERLPKADGGRRYGMISLIIKSLLQGLLAGALVWIVGLGTMAWLERRERC